MREHARVVRDGRLQRAGDTCIASDKPHQRLPRVATSERRTPGFMMSEIIDVPFPRAESSCLTSFRIFQLRIAARGQCNGVSFDRQDSKKQPAEEDW